MAGEQRARLLGRRPVYVSTHRSSVRAITAPTMTPRSGTNRGLPSRSGTGRERTPQRSLPPEPRLDWPPYGDGRPKGVTDHNGEL
jgi:hypothetical protein